MRHRPTPTQPQRTGQTLWALALLCGAGVLCVATSSPPPVIERVSPNLGSSSVRVDQPLEVVFEQPVDPDTVTADSVRLRRVADDELIAGSFELTESNRRLTFKPDFVLAPQTDYQLELDLAKIRSSDGDAYVGLRYDEGSQSVWETSGLLSVPFTTRQELAVARAFLQSDPAWILIYFSEPVDSRAISTATVTLEDSRGEVPIDLRYNETERRLTIIPLADLESQASYVVRLSGEIITPDGASLESGLGDVLSFEASEERIR